MRLVLALALALSTWGCAALLPYLVAAGQVAQWIATVVDQVDASQEAWFAEKPSPDLQMKVEAAIAKTRSALTVLNEAVASAESANDGKVEEAKQRLLKAYEEMYKLLESSGMLGAPGELSAAPGAPATQLPTPDELGAKLQ